MNFPTVLCLVAAVFTFGCGNERNRIPTGNLEDAMKEQTSFYTIRGGSDYERLPLRYPFHLVDVTGTADLCNGKVVLVENVTGINVSSNLIYGSFGMSVSFGETNNGGWFVVEGTNKLSTGDRNVFRTKLEACGITNQLLLPASTLITQFMHQGVLPFGSNNVTASPSNK